MVYVTRGWSDDHAWSDGELAEALAAGRLVSIEPLPEKTQLGWMSAFAGALEDGWARDALVAALSAGAPLAAFEAALGRFPAERVSWLACRGARVRAVLRAWLEANDIEAADAALAPDAAQPEAPPDGRVERTEG